MKIASRVLRYAAIAYAVLVVATCELAPLPTHSFCWSERRFLDKEDIILRFIERGALHRRQSVFPLAPEKTAQEVYALSPKSWSSTRSLFSIFNWEIHAWSVGFYERIESQCGSWEGYAFVDSCGRSLDFFSMPNYDEGTDRGYRKVGGAPCKQAD